MLRTIFTIAFDRESKIWDAMRIFLFVYLGIYLGGLGISAEPPLLRFYPCHAIGPALVSCLSRGRLRGITVCAGSSVPPCVRAQHSGFGNH